MNPDPHPPAGTGGASTVRIRIQPLGHTWDVPHGTAFKDFLFALGVEFPCGGRGRCKGCRVRCLAGNAAVTSDDERLLTALELAAGWRLACRCRAETDLTIELAQWEATILADDTPFAFEPREGLGAAVDVGTTTLAAQLLDLRTGQVLGVRTAWNDQARHGGDIMSRIDFAVHGSGQSTLTGLIREQVGRMLQDLLTEAPGRDGELRDVILVGNTVMHHLFCGISVEPLSAHPFNSGDDGLRSYPSAALGWTFGGGATVRFLPSLGGFVGSDLLAGILATRLHEAERLEVLVDLGTNGEIVVGNRERLLCASTAAGPAFEGARISCGMRAANGAISEVMIEQGRLAARVIGGGLPRGLCGSGLVDAVAAGLDLGVILRNGRLTAGRTLEIAPPVHLRQEDIRELQLAKGAIAAGVRLLVGQWGGRLEDVERVYLAGAFGNYVNRASAARIGLIGFPPARVFPAGNTALLGAKLALFNLPGNDGSYRELLGRIRHVALNEDPQFQEVYVEEMGFPDRPLTGGIDQLMPSE